MVFIQRSYGKTTDSCLNSPVHASYIGKTIRQAIRRFKEHGTSEQQIIPTSSFSSTTTTNPQLDPPNYNLRRSARNTNKVVNYFPKEIPIRETKLTIKFAVHDHEVDYNHTIDWENWKILAKDPRPYRLLVKESLAIQQQQPKLNKTISSIPLIVFPDRLSRLKPRVKMKQ
jgi:hypothetical protein